MDGPLFWEWTAHSSGIVQIDTFGSDFDTELAVYTGTDLAALREIVSNDDASIEILESSVRFAVEMGTAYQIAVDGYVASEGNISLNIGTGFFPDVICLV